MGKKTTLTVDGHALFDQNDYKLTLDLRREDFGYIRVDVSDYRTWYNGAGGYYPPTGVQYQLPDDDLYLDRGMFSFEAGLTPKDLPKVVFKYTHSYRDGDISSTIWGPVPSRNDHDGGRRVSFALRHQREGGQLRSDIPTTSRHRFWRRRALRDRDLER